VFEENNDLGWIGIRPLQMGHGIKKERYRLGFNAYNGFSKITFSDCAHVIVNMLVDDTWLGKLPITQY
jgi:hypothetical protein